MLKRPDVLLRARHVSFSHQGGRLEPMAFRELLGFLSQVRTLDLSGCVDVSSSLLALIPSSCPRLESLRLDLARVTHEGSLYPWTSLTHDWC
jgi:hypothetical protein